MNASDIKLKKIVDYQDIYYPPGGILLWILIFLELFTFGIALVVMVYQSKSEPLLFHRMSAKLNTLFGSVNTVVLLTSGYFMAKSVHFFKDKKYDTSKKFLIGTSALGFLFMVIKSFEYYHKITEGLMLGSNTFMNFYWLLTGFHLIHVLAGMLILSWMYYTVSKSPDQTEVLDFEAGASFWHLCDLIWLLLFPVLYLLF